MSLNYTTSTLDDLRQLRQELCDLQRFVQEQEGELREQSTEKAALCAQRDETKRRLDDAQWQIANLELQVASIGELQEQLADEKEQNTDKQATLERRIEELLQNNRELQTLHDNCAEQLHESKAHCQEMSEVRVPISQIKILFFTGVRHCCTHLRAMHHRNAESHR